MASGGATALNLRSVRLRCAAAAVVLGGLATGIAVAAADGSDSSAATRPSAGASTALRVGSPSAQPAVRAGGGPALPTVAAGEVGVAGGASAPVGSGGSAATDDPIRVQIPAIGVDSTLQPLKLLRDGALQAPSRWQRAGWYADGVAPGEVGPAVIAGHVDSTKGPAVFFRLKQLRRGEQVRVTRRDGRRLTFVIDKIAEFPKRHFPTEYVYGPTPDAQLRLVTCTGDFDAAKHSYVDNLVVSAHLV